MWEVLRDFDKYSEWNTFNPGVVTTGVIGDPIALTVRLRGFLITQKETVRDLTAPKSLVWDMTTLHRSFLWAERVQTITATETGSHYVTVDTIGGALSPFVSLFFGHSLQTGFEQMAADLRAHSRW